MKLGLFGYPVGHSRSPRLFSLLQKYLQKSISYEAVAVPPGQLPLALERALLQGWRGANVTVPLKEEAFESVIKTTPAAKAIGAVNVIRFGRINIGHNTDGLGICDALKRAKIQPRANEVLIFGAGGSARAAGWALAHLGASSISFEARTVSRAKKVAHDLSKYFPRTKFTVGLKQTSTIWVNATPLGMKGFPRRSPAPFTLPPPKAAVDLVYGAKTAFIRQASKQGAKVVDGRAILVFQALRAFEFWDKPLGQKKRNVLAENLMREVFS